MLVGLGEPLCLPCGVVLQNRIAKSAMSDSLGDGCGRPGAAQARLYERWAEAGAALQLIGEVQSTPHYPESPGNLVLRAGPGASKGEERFRELARRGTGDWTQIWPQLGHCGALAHEGLGVRCGPSALDLPGLRCEEMPLDEIRALPDLFAGTAALAREYGFGGVQIHAGHGYLLSQFLSPLFNRRTDDYSGSVTARARVVLEICEAVRGAVGPAFPVAVKINATDGFEGGLTPDDAVATMRLAGQAGIDLIEVSGGTYFPASAGTPIPNTDRPYYRAVSARAREAAGVPVMLTGGIRTREEARQALINGDCDMVGLARAMVLDPGLPAKWLSPEGGDPQFPRFEETPPGAVTAWYAMRLHALANDAEKAFSMTAVEALAQKDRIERELAVVWKDAFAAMKSAPVEIFGTGRKID